MCWRRRRRSCRAALWSGARSGRQTPLGGHFLPTPLFFGNTAGCLWSLTAEQIVAVLIDDNDDDDDEDDDNNDEDDDGDADDNNNIKKYYC